MEIFSIFENIKIPKNWNIPKKLNFYIVDF